MDTAITKKRKREICLAAKEVFLTRGIERTTMEHLIRAAGMSKGGVYYYYSSPSEILVDLCRIGMEIRKTTSDTYQLDHPELPPEDLLIELVIEKMFGGSEYLKLWAMLLVASAKDETIKATCDQIREEQKQLFLQWIDNTPFQVLAPLAGEEFATLMDSMYLAGLYLDTDDFFKNRSDLFRQIIRNYLQSHKKEEQ